MPTINQLVRKGRAVVKKRNKVLETYNKELLKNKKKIIKENIKDFAKINHPTDLETFTAVRSLKDNS